MKTSLYIVSKAPQFQNTYSPHGDGNDRFDAETETINTCFKTLIPREGMETLRSHCYLLIKD
ncbi:hypothetical protein [Crocosphaera chwakensis]|uniref:hypothetical protein n=1 Tax=Crocosphaera chwakensis TaxID=2546361 RepID=UPI0012F8664A|nr:hypothetical protein [Crocosphaera chwakensis]